MIIMKLIPLIGFAALGVLCRKKNYLSRGTVDQIKWIVVNILLPGILFRTFLTATLKGGLIYTALAVFGANVALMGVGFLAARLHGSGKRYAPFMMGGMEYGMLGLALFASLYGVANIQYIAVVDLGHEFFFWFLLAPVFRAREEGKPGIPIMSFILSPINIGIVIGLVLNVTGLGTFVTANFFGAGIVSTCDMMGSAIGPIILLVIGFGLRFPKESLKDVILTVVIRLVFAFGLAFVIGVLLIRNLLGWSIGYTAGIWILFATSPSYSIPIFAKNPKLGEEAYITSVLAVYTVITFIAAAFVLYVYPVLAYREND